MAGEAKFNEQSFLIDFLRDIRGDEAILPKPQNYIQITNQTSYLMNTIYGSGGGEMLNLTSEQISLLVPKIRLFKVIRKGKTVEEKEFYFPENTTVRSITSPQGRGRGLDVGIQSFSWKDLGTNQANSGLSFQCELKLYFQNFESIFLDRSPSPPFSDLLVPAGGRKKNEKYAKTVYDDSDYQIKAIVGWATPTKTNFFPNPEIIDRMRVPLLMNLTSHDVNIKDDGSVELTINFFSAIEGRMLSPKANIFRFSPDEKTEREIKEAEKSLRTLSVKTQLKKAQTGQTGSNELTKEIQREIKNLKNQIISQKRDGKYFTYKRILDNIESNLLGTSGRIFHIELSSPQVEIYKEMKNITPQAVSTGGKKIKQKYKPSLEEFRLHRQAFMKAGEGFIGPALPGQVGLPKLKVENERTYYPAANKLVINFVFFGDLIDSVIKVYKENNTEEADQFGFVLGTIPIFDPVSGEYVSVPLADIPISLNYYENWFRKNVINSNSNFLSMQFFLSSICKKMISNIVKNIKFNDVSSILPRTNYLSGVGKNTKLVGRVELSNSKKSAKSSELSNVFSSIEMINATKVKDIKQYNILYTSLYGSRDLTGQYSKDVGRNIFHLFAGAARGIIKNISFERTNQPGMREARIAGSANLANRNLLFSDFYKSRITMFGNTIFKPGMIVYVNTKALGVSNSNESESKTKFLGLGGYYTVINVDSVIESGKYETEISLMSLGNRDYFQPIQFDYKKEEKIKADSELEKAVEKRLADAQARIEKRKKIKDELLAFQTKTGLTDPATLALANEEIAKKLKDVGFDVETVDVQNYKGKIEFLKNKYRELGGDLNDLQ